ncbi:MAG: DUF1538 domain-containing protein [Clostridiales bacterium]|nr:DUF1538 domain-containing protein [Clostridiales bacterium]
MKAVLLKLRESLISVLPIAVLVLILSATPLVNLSGMEIAAFSVAAVFLILGIGLFNLGADLAMTPMGEQVGGGLTKSKKITVLLVVCFLMGVFITIAEPDLSVLAEQVKSVMNSTLLIVTVGIGVGLFLLLAVLKIIMRKDLSAMLMFFYMALFALCALLIESGKNDFLAMCFDSGGVTTGPITVPFIMALGVGIATTIGGKNSNENSFGLVALCSIGPILAVTVLSIASKGSIDYTAPTDTVASMMANCEWGWTILETCKEVIIALALIVAFFIVLQIFVLKLPKDKIIRIVIGIAYTFVGLVVFLSAVKIGFMPIGLKLGQLLAENRVVLVIFGLVFGMVVVLAEPAIHVLNKQVEEVTGGGVTKTQMMVALCLGVGLAIALSMIRIIYDFSVLYYLIPGYLLSLGLSFFVPKLYTAIAFDSGGVASGPLTSGFILPLAIGACLALNGADKVLELAFGVVALVAMIPLITIQTLGFKAVMSAKARNRIIMKRILSADDEQIINFAWEKSNAK